MQPETLSDAQQVKNTLATRIKTLNILLLVLVLLLVVGASGLMLMNTNANAAQSTARAYSGATAAKLQAFIGQNLALARIAADSAVMGAWYGDEANQEKKRAAFAELTNYLGDNPGLSLRLCLSGSMNVYLADATLAYADFQPYGQLDPAAPGDGWYATCADAAGAYTSHLGVSTDPDERQLIICHKISGAEGLNGVFSLGADLKPLLAEIAGLTEDKAAGCLIDQRGEVVSGSFFPSTTGALESAGLKAALGTAAVTTADAAPDGAPAQLVKLTQGSYKYAVITPIAATDWSYAVLYNQDLAGGLLSDRNLPLLPLALLLILALYFLIFNAYIRKIVFNPLKNLTNSVPRGGVIYGMGRDDEIGALARRINSMYFSISAHSNKVQEANEHLRFFLDSLPVACHIWNKEQQIIACNRKALELYGFKEKYEFTDHFFQNAPEQQPGNQSSVALMNKMLEKTFGGETVTFTWRAQTPAPNPALEVTLVRVISGNTYVVAAYSFEK